MKMVQAEEELQKAREQLNQAETERQNLKQGLVDKQQELEDDSNTHSQHVKEYGELLTLQQEINAQLQEATQACMARQDEINATQAFIDDMQAEADRNTAMIQEADEK